MKKPSVSVSIDDTLKHIYISERWLKYLIMNILACIEKQGRVEMGMRLTDNAGISELNRRYRGKDRATDVLSFGMLEAGGDMAFVDAPDRIEHIGEVVISWEKAAEQAQKYKTGIKREITILSIHGILHLMGYDHDKEDDYQAMQAEENNILNCVESRVNLNERDHRL
jgi:probable rRNA maturation factor